MTKKNIKNIKNEKKKKLLQKKKLLISGLIVGTIGIGLFGHKDKEYHPQYKINRTWEDDLQPFGSYRSGNVYIVQKEHYDDVLKICNSDDIVVIDVRTNENPNMIVCNSSYIWDKEVINDILNILLEYENMYPSLWDRNIESLRNEWLIHNIAFKLGINTDDTESADLDNKEGIYFDHKVLTKILRN